MSIRRVYLLGPMTGYPNDNRDLFNEVAIQLRSHGFDVLNPSELDDGRNVPGRTACYARDLPHLVACDAGVALPGWRRSVGASLEAITFVTLERPILVWPTLRQLAPDELPRIVHPA